MIEAGTDLIVVGRTTIGTGTGSTSMGLVLGEPEAEEREEGERERVRCDVGDFVCDDVRAWKCWYSTDLRIFRFMTISGHERRR